MAAVAALLLLVSACADTAQDDVGPCGWMVWGLQSYGLPPSKALVEVTDFHDTDRVTTLNGRRYSVLAATVERVLVDYGTALGADQPLIGAIEVLKSLECVDDTIPEDAYLVLGLSGIYTPAERITWILMHTLVADGDHLRFVVGQAELLDKWTCQLDNITRAHNPGGRLRPTLEDSITVLAALIDRMVQADPLGSEDTWWEAAEARC